jgi:transcriptional regulator with XRE-family HTH domain
MKADPDDSAGAAPERRGRSESDRQLLSLFGSRIRKARKANELSIAVLARQAGVDASYLGELERGRKNVSLVTAARIAAVLGVPINTLLTPDRGVTDKQVPLR